MRGNLCPFDHYFSNVDPIVVDESTLKLPAMMRVTDSILGRAGESIPGLDGSAAAGAGEEMGGGSYNPENPFMKAGQTSAIPVWPQQQPGLGLQPIPTLTGRGAGGQLLSLPQGLLPPLLSAPLPLRNNDESFRNDLTSGGPLFMSGGGGGGRGGRGRGRGGMRGRGPPKRPYNQDGEEGGSDNSQSGGGGGYGGGGGGGHYQPQQRRRRFEKRPTTDSICVARIPAELNTIEQLNSHFKKFGTIVNIQVYDILSSVFFLYLFCLIVSLFLNLAFLHTLPQTFFCPNVFFNNNSA